MIGVNRDQSKGDFKYKNIRSDAAKQEAQRVIDIYQAPIDNFTVNSINDSVTYGYITEDQAKIFLSNTDDWQSYISTVTENGKTQFYNDLKEKYSHDLPSSASAAWATIKTYYPEWNSRDKRIEMTNAWKQGNQSQYGDIYGAAQAQKVSDTMDPNKNASIKMDKEVVAQYTKNKNYLGNGWRWRRYNDYKNTDVITKWQNNHWTVKGTWKQVLRHLPRAVFHDAGDSYIDTDALYYGMAKTRQNLIDKEMLVSWRNQAGRLDWGWTVDYLDQQKRYRCENWEELDALNPNTVYSQTPFRKWSAYNSHKWNGGIDGTYHAGDRNLIEFYANYSDETYAGTGERRHRESAQGI
jgi:vitamin B12 transporter